jgi:hypothetical protein
MPLLRRPHDHCRGLCARQRTARSPVPQPRRQNRNSMRLATTSLRHPLARALRSRRRPTVIPATANSHARPRAVPKSRCRAQQRQPILDRQRPQRRRPTPLPPKPLPNQIPIDREPLTSPRGSFFGGFRTPALTTAVQVDDEPASETLHESSRYGRSPGSRLVS